jgi:hypothetical protein
MTDDAKFPVTGSRCGYRWADRKLCLDDDGVHACTAGRSHTSDHIWPCGDTARLDLEPGQAEGGCEAARHWTQLGCSQTECDAAATAVEVDLDGEEWPVCSKHSFLAQTGEGDATAHPALKPPCAEPDCDSRAAATYYDHGVLWPVCADHVAERIIPPPQRQPPAPRTPPHRALPVDRAQMLRPQRQRRPPGPTMGP